MSIEAFPILYLNMAGEMVYIIQQRLLAQSIEKGKAEKVLNDIMGAIYARTTVDQAFTPQELMPMNLLKKLFEKLAHTSIMKLNEQSMNKLFDLMVMVFKYQLVQIGNPLDLLQVTLNHIDSTKEMISSNDTRKLVTETRDKLVAHFGDYNVSYMQFIRHTLLSYLLNIRTRVSIFLREGLQENDGTFVLKRNGTVSCECQIPGSIRYFDEKGELSKTDSFPPGCSYVESSAKTTLGMNIYAKELMNPSPDVRRRNQLAQQQGQTIEADQQPSIEPNQPESTHLYEDAEGRLSDETLKEHQLLTQLVGRTQLNDFPADNSFWLTLELGDSIATSLPTSAGDRSSENSSSMLSESVKEVQAKRDGHREGILESVRQELLLDVSKLCEENPDNDLLSLMDSG